MRRCDICNFLSDLTTGITVLGAIIGVIKFIYDCPSENWAVVMILTGNHPFIFLYLEKLYK
jgi:hypothetical protein